MCRATPTIDLSVLIPSEIPFDEALDREACDADPDSHRRQAAKEDELDRSLRQDIVRELPLLPLQTVKSSAGFTVRPKLDTKNTHITLYFHDQEAAAAAELGSKAACGLCANDGTGHLAKIIFGKYTTKHRNCFKAKFEIGDPFQLLRDQQPVESDAEDALSPPPIRRGAVRRITTPLSARSTPRRLIEPRDVVRL